MELKKRLEAIAKDRFLKDFARLGRADQYACVALLVNEKATEQLQKTQTQIAKKKVKEVYYFSIEFLLGRMLLNNIANMGLFTEFNELLLAYGLTLKDLETEERDAGLGNGGLGRLAACFLDSIASLNYAGHGVTLRYKNGFFQQSFVDGEQVELPDNWLQDGYVWEKQVPEAACTISFYGSLETKREVGKVVSKLVNTVDVKAMPYDMVIIGAGLETVNTLRMYDVCPITGQIGDENYEQEVKEITRSLYPDDSTLAGKELRLKQQYVLVSAGAQNIIKNHWQKQQSLERIMDYVVIQINDTHPVLIIPEIMRIFMDDYNYDYASAWAITTKMVAYTNHTILKEALEEWDESLLQVLLPRIYEIIGQINNAFKNQLQKLDYTQAKINKLAIIGDGKVRMAHLAIVASFRVNGVAALHTEILQSHVLKDWHTLYPGKIINRTNGITHRRWFDYVNPKLSQLLQKHITAESRSNPEKWFAQFLQYQENKHVLTELADIKQANKLNLLKYIKEKEGFLLNEHSIFDVQIKRLHAYKRQLLNVLHIIYLYERLKIDTDFYNNFYPQTFIFGAKAAPSYVLAKNIIKLIKLLERTVQTDSKVREKLTVVMVTNYNVSYAEKLIPATDISEQISTSGYEASGTGNMKFMMNGALTIGTLDGANVEIYDRVGEDNIVIFGLTKDEVKSFHANGTYNAYDYVSGNEELKMVLSWLKEHNTNGEFQPIIDNLFVENDYYLVLPDFVAYKEAQARLNAWYKNKDCWYKKTLVNIAKSGFFSSDRTIKEYVDEIWQLKKITDN